MEESRSGRDVGAQQRAVERCHAFGQRSARQQAVEMIAIGIVELRFAGVMDLMSTGDGQCDGISAQAMRSRPRAGGDRGGGGASGRWKNSPVIREPRSRAPEASHVRRRLLRDKIRPVAVANDGDDDGMGHDNIRKWERGYFRVGSSLSRSQSPMIETARVVRTMVVAGASIIHGARPRYS